MTRRELFGRLLAQLATLPPSERIDQAHRLAESMHRNPAASSDYRLGVADALAAVGHPQYSARHGWRLDFVRPIGVVGWYGEPDRNPDRDDPTGIFRRAIGARMFTPRAFCLSSSHLAPAHGCACGWRLLTDPGELHPDARGLHSTGRPWSWSKRLGIPRGLGPGPGDESRDNIIERAAIVEVMAHGLTFKIDDTTTSFVSERLERLSIHLIANRTDATTDVCRLYGDDVEVHSDIDACIQALIERSA